MDDGRTRQSVPVPQMPIAVDAVPVECRGAERGEKLSHLAGCKTDYVVFRASTYTPTLGAMAGVNLPKKRCLYSALRQKRSESRPSAIRSFRRLQVADVAVHVGDFLV